MDNWSKYSPSVQRDTELLVRLIRASKYDRDDVTELINAYSSMYEKAVEYHCRYTTERMARVRLEAENAFLTQLINRYESDGII